MAARIPAYSGTFTNPIQRQVPRKSDQIDSHNFYDIELADNSFKRKSGTCFNSARMLNYREKVNVKRK